MTEQELKDKTKPIVKSIINKIQVYGFWFLLAVGIGAWCGIEYESKQNTKAINQAVKVGGFTVGNDVYDMKKRLVQ